MMNGPPQGHVVAMCDLRSPQGFGPCVTLFADRLLLESRGALGGGLRDDIPLASIRGFYAVTYQFKDALTHSNVGDAFDQFLVAWQDANGKDRVTKWMIDTRTPPFQALLGELARLRPDASLLHLPSADAHRALGVRSLNQIGCLATVITVVVVLVVIVGIVVALAMSSSGPTPPPGPARAPASASPGPGP
jgi:hypothetical protein